MMQPSRLVPLSMIMAGLLLAAGRPTVARQARAAPKAKSAAAPTKVQVVGLHVDRATPGDSGVATGGSPLLMRLNRMDREGTLLTLSLALPDRRIVEFDAKASRVARFADDKATDLTKPPPQPAGIAAFGPEIEGPFAGSLDPEGHRCLVDVRAPRTPAPGATKLTLKADLTLRCGASEKTVEQKDLDLKPGNKVTAGPVPLTILDDKGGLGSWPMPGGGLSQMTVWVSHPRPLTEVKEVAFLGPDGKPIPQVVAIQTTEGFGDAMIYKTQYALAKKVGRATVRVTYFDKIEPLIVPVSVEVGVGF